MALKDESWRLALESYPATLLLQTRFADMDANAHLNNVAIARLFEEARVRTLSALRKGARAASNTGDPSSMLIAHVGIDYLAEGRYPEDVIAGIAVSDIGRSSFRLALVLFQQGRAIAIADCAMVNLEGRKPGAISPDLRTALDVLRQVPMPPSG